LLHPSRGRAEQARSTLNKWVDNAYNPDQLEHVISVDNDDPQLLQYRDLFPTSTQVIGPNTNVVQAANAGAKQATGNVLLYLSDDFMCPPEWDRLLDKLFKDCTEPRLVKVDDCLQGFEKDVLTIPIMNRQLYEKLGYFFHPAYKSMFVDQDLYHTVNNMKAMVLCEYLKFPHLHCSIGKAPNDETYTRSNANWNSGKATYLVRKAKKFPL